MEDKNGELKVKQRLDGITSAKTVNQEEITEDMQKKHDAPMKSPHLETAVTDNKVPHRGILWYILFVLVFIIMSSLTIYFTERAVLFVLVVSTVAILWHGHNINKMKLEINDTGIVVNGRIFLFVQIDRYYFSEIGDDITLNIVLAKKRFPILTYILLDSNDFEKIREKLANQIPETEPREESFTDLFIRKLKL